MDRVHIIFFFFSIGITCMGCRVQKKCQKILWIVFISFFFCFYRNHLWEEKLQDGKSAAAAAAVAVPVKYWRARTISSEAAY